MPVSANKLNYTSWNILKLHKYGFLVHFNSRKKHELDSLVSVLQCTGAKVFYVNSSLIASKLETLTKGTINFQDCLIITFETFHEFLQFPFFLTTAYKFNYNILYKKVNNNFFSLNFFDSFFLSKLVQLNMINMVSDGRGLVELTQFKLKLLLKFNIISRFLLVLRALKNSRY